MKQKSPKNQTNPQPQTDTEAPNFQTPSILPPALFYSAAMLVLLFGYLETGRFGQSYLGLILTVLAIFVAAKEKGRFAKIGTTIFPGKDASKLVTDGAFRYSRNPMYLAMVIGLFGLWPLTGGYSPLLPIAVFTAIIHHSFILQEEKHLTRLFGVDYEDYKKRVRRWL